MQMTSKSELRAQLSNLRPHSSQGLYENLVRLTLELQAEVIVSYWPLPSEPDVTQFNNWVTLTGRKLLTPRIVDDKLEFASGQAVVGKYGINEPTSVAEEIDRAQLVLVPALAVDSRGFRLGKGKGFYDKTLAGRNLKTFAVVFDQEFFETIPIEDHDQRVIGAVSPSAIRFFNN